jgi:hypothetical protein
MLMLDKSPAFAWRKQVPRCRVAEVSPIYAGEVTHLTRRGQRVAAIVSTARLATAEAVAREDAIARVCQALWESVQDADEATRARVREVIDRALGSAEDATNPAAAETAEAELEAGAAPGPPEQLWREMQLKDRAAGLSIVQRPEAAGRYHPVPGEAFLL